MIICSDDQMFKCSNVQMFKYINAQIFKCSNVQMFKCLKFKFSIVQILKWFNVQTFKCSNVQIFNVPIVHVPMFQCSNVQKFRYSDVRCTDGIIFKCPNIHMSKMLIFCWSVHLEFFRSFLFGFSWHFWKMGFVGIYGW